MKTNKLPQYWVVKNDGSQLFKDTVIKYMNDNTVGYSNWPAKHLNAFYGYDGNRCLSGFNVSIRNLSEFVTPVTVLSIQQFIEMTEGIDNSQNITGSGWTPTTGETILVRGDIHQPWVEVIFLFKTNGWYHCIAKSDEYKLEMGAICLAPSPYNQIKQLKKIIIKKSEIRSKFNIDNDTEITIEE